MAEADPERLIPPSMVDGLKPGQRKVLFCCFERNLVKQTRVTQLICYALERAAYQHGEQSLASTIVSMAQNFVGSNNIGLLVPDGPYGTRHRGGEDAALSFEAVYSLLTRLPPIARLIFPKDDDVLLDYLSEDGKSVEPRWYMPTIPMVLVNGSGIGTASSCYVPNYNPRDIIANLKGLLNGETVVPMDPWYKGFKGSLKKTCSNGAGVTYSITGVIEQVDDTKLIITELPVRCWTEDYRKFLDSMCPVPIKKKKKDNDKERNKEPSFLVEEYRSQCDHANVEIEVILSENNVNIAKQEGLEKKFNMTTTIGTTNMQLFDSDGKIRKYDTPEDILKEFFKLRLEFYGRRKAVMLQNIEKELSKPKNKARFIFAVNSGDIVVSNRKRAELLLELKQKGYEPSPNEKTTAKQVGGENDYDYLLEMAIRTLTLEKVRELVAEQKKLEDEFESLGKTTPETLWLRDLDALEKEMDVLDAEFEAEQEETRRRRENYLKDEKESKEAPKRRPKKTSYKSQKEKLAGSRDDDFETKPAAQKKIPVKKASAPVRHDDDEALNLKDRLAAYTIGDSPPERSAVESETTKEQKGKKRRNEPSKRGVTKKAMAPLTELSGENEDNKFAVEEVQVGKKARGRKPAAEKPKKTAIRKRAPAQSNSSAPSPEKKVRQMRDSPFDKKSGSVSQRVASASTSAEDAEAPPPSGSSAQHVAPRRSARLKQSTSID